MSDTSEPPELPPVEFCNLINTLQYEGYLKKEFNWDDWRSSPEWISYRTGYNAGLNAAISVIKQHVP